MKEIDPRHAPEVSGGLTSYPTDSPCFPPFPNPIEQDYPRNPLVPRTDEPICPDATA